MINTQRLSYFKKLHKQGKLDRREFMQGMIATGMTVASASSLWSTDVLAQTPNKGGHFRMAIGGGATSDTLDPGTFFESYMQTAGFGLRNCLANSTMKITWFRNWLKAGTPMRILQSGR